MSKALDGVVDLLDLEQVELNIFRGRSPEGERRQRVFGGQVAGQALVAAGRTVPANRPVHSLHAYFIRPGDPTVPLVYLVERVRDGRSFTTRRVTVVQHGETIFTLSASFHDPQPGGFDHFVPMPAVPGPEEIEPTAVRLRRLYGAAAEDYARDSPIDIRHVGPLLAEARAEARAEGGTGPAGPDTGVLGTGNVVWLKADGDLPDDPLLHVCVMTYASDMTLLDTVLRTQGVSWADGGIIGASLDHAMWFHRPFRADRWLLYAQDSPSASDSRGLARGEIYSQDGTLVVSVVQEGLLRRQRSRS
jgi:acyl-CoA thioesterase II